MGVIRGTQQRVDMSLCKLMAGWLVLGIPIPYYKAATGTTLIWTGLKLQLMPHDVIASLTKDKTDELLHLATDILQSNVVAYKKLHTFVSNVQAAASLLYALRPYAAMIWAGLYSPSDAPTNCTWVKQISQAVAWLIVFLQQGQAGPLPRTFRFSSTS